VDDRSQVRTWLGAAAVVAATVAATGAIVVAGTADTAGGPAATEETGRLIGSGASLALAED
jgi:heme A synthase